MTKRLEIQFRRHPHSYKSPEGKKFDGPSLQGLDEVRKINSNIRSHLIDGGNEYWLCRFYASPTYRTSITAELMRENVVGLGRSSIDTYNSVTAQKEYRWFSDELKAKHELCFAVGNVCIGTPEVIIAPAIRPTTRSPEYEKAMKAACPSGKESDLVAYSLNPDNLTAGTESPAELGQRNLDHILGLRSHFEQIADKKTGYIENITHEPNLTAVMMRVLNMERYDAAVFQGAANTTETIAVTMEQRPSGIVAVRMQYRNLEASLTL
jgi:hypothetical protein